MKYAIQFGQAGSWSAEFNPEFHNPVTYVWVSCNQRYLKSQGLISEAEILCGDEPRQEMVDAFSDRGGKCDNSIGSWFTIQAAGVVW